MLPVIGADHQRLVRTWLEVASPRSRWRSASGRAVRGRLPHGECAGVVMPCAVNPAAGHRRRHHFAMTPPASTTFRSPAATCSPTWMSALVAFHRAKAAEATIHHRRARPVGLRRGGHDDSRVGPFVERPAPGTEPAASSTPAPCAGYSVLKRIRRPEGVDQRATFPRWPVRHSHRGLLAGHRRRNPTWPPTWTSSVDCAATIAASQSRPGSRSRPRRRSRTA